MTMTLDISGTVQVHIYSVSQKTAPFSFCNNFVKQSSFSIIFGTDIAE